MSDFSDSGLRNYGNHGKKVYIITEGYARKIAVGFAVLVVVVLAGGAGAVPLIVDGISVTKGGNESYDYVTIKNGGTVNVDSSIGYWNVVATYNVTIDSTSKIDGNQKSSNSAGGGGTGGASSGGRNPANSGTSGGGYGGGGGGGGIACGSPTGGGGGSGTPIVGTLTGRYDMAQGNSAGGGGGGGACYDVASSATCNGKNGAGGQGGGAAVRLSAPLILVQGQITVNGGAGGNGGNGGDGVYDSATSGGAGGGGGGGATAGTIIIDGQLVNISLGTFQLVGGFGGVGGSPGYYRCGHPPSGANGGTGSGGRLKIFYRVLYNNSVMIDLGSGGTIFYEDQSAPVIIIQSPLNQTYKTNIIPLNVSANKAISTWQYSLNGVSNVSFLPNTTITASQGANNLILYASDIAGNWNSSMVYFYVDSIAPSRITNLQNVSYAKDYINWTWTDPTDSDFSYVMVYLDDVFKTNVMKGVQYYNATGLSSGTTYTISTRTVDNTGNINTTPISHTASTSMPDNPPGSVTGLMNVSYARDYIKWTWTDPTDSDFSYVMVYLDDVFKTNVLKGIQYYNATDLSPGTTYTISTRTVDNTGNINTTPISHSAITSMPDNPPGSVTRLVNVSYARDYIKWTWTDPTDSDFSYVMVYLDDVFKTNVLKGIQYYNATDLSPGTTYTISTRTVDNTGKAIAEY